jgi:hypothetical protein
LAFSDRLHSSSLGEAKIHFTRATISSAIHRFSAKLRRCGATIVFGNNCDLLGNVHLRPWDGHEAGLCFSEAALSSEEWVEVCVRERADLRHRLMGNRGRGCRLLGVWPKVA